MDAKLIDALKVIKAECSRHDDCMECQLYDYDNKSCVLCDGLEYPNEWIFAEE